MDMTQNVYNVRIPAFGRVQIQSNTTLAYVSGEVPRLVVQQGSDAFDIWERQCLPVNGNVAWLCNPNSSEIFVNIAFGLPTELGTFPFEGSITRHQEKINFWPSYSTATADAVKRIGYGIMTKRGTAEMWVQSTSLTFFKATVLQGARPDFMQFKPAAAFNQTCSMVTRTGENANNYLMVGGYYDSADITAWIAASGYTGTMTEYIVEAFTANNRFYFGPDTAVFISREPNASGSLKLMVKEYGLAAEEFD